MKSVMIVFNQANTERVEYMLDKLGIRGFTFFEQVQGRGSKTGNPRRGTHTWPEMNSAVITVVEDEQVNTLLETVHKLDLRNEDVGVRAFVWNIEQTIWRRNVTEIDGWDGCLSTAILFLRFPSLLVNKRFNGLW